MTLMGEGDALWIPFGHLPLITSQMEIGSCTVVPCLSKNMFNLCKEGDASRMCLNWLHNFAKSNGKTPFTEMVDPLYEFIVATIK